MREKTLKQRNTMWEIPCGKYIACWEPAITFPRRGCGFLPNFRGNLRRIAEAQCNYGRALTNYGKAVDLDPLDPAHHY
jgi:hypothetical protein